MMIRDEAAKDRVLRALADEYSRSILLSTVHEPKSIAELSRQDDIPISTAYRRIQELTAAGLVAIERSVITDEGKRYELYRSTVKSARILLEAGSVEVELVPNEDMVAKFVRLWGYVKGQ